MRAIRNLEVRIGLVSIPIKLVKIIEEHPTSTINITKCCNSRIVMKRFCPVCGKENPEVMKMIEDKNGNLVPVVDMNLVDSPVLDSIGFIPLSQINLLSIYNSYGIIPDEGGEMALSLLYETLKKLGVGLLTKGILFKKEYPILIYPYGNGLILSLLYFYDEIREVKIEIKEVDEKMRNLMEQLIEAMKVDISALINIKEEKWEKIKREELPLDKALEQTLVITNKKKREKNVAVC